MKANLTGLFTFLTAMAVSSTAAAYTSSYYTRTSLLSSGHTVKVAADTTGIYEISYERLRELGFANPEKVTVYGYGATVALENDIKASYPDDLPAAPSMHTADGRLLFFADGVISARYSSPTAYTVLRNTYDTKAYYYLSDIPSTDSDKMASHPFSEAGGDSYPVLDWGYYLDYIENEVQNPGKGSVFFHDRKMKAGETSSYIFNVRDFYESPTTSGWFRYDGAAMTREEIVRFQLTASENVKMTATTSSGASGTSKTTVIFRNLGGTTDFSPAPSGALENAAVTFNVSVPSGFTGAYAAVDKVCAIYPRHIRLRNINQLVFNLKAAGADQRFTVADADASTEVWNVTTPLNAFRYETSYDPATATVSASLSQASVRTPSRIIAFKTSASFSEPEIVGEVAHQNIHGTRNPDMIIVSTESNYEYAVELADIHRQYQGLDVLVVTQEQVFNEFSSGVCHPNAVRRMVKMFFDRDPSSLRFLLMYGQPTYDYRGVEIDKKDYLVIYQVDTTTEAQEHTTNYCSDLFFGMVSDTYKHESLYRIATDISVGRIPANTPAEAADANAKIREHMQNPPSVKNYLSALMLSGTGDKYMHLAQSNLASQAMRAVSNAFTPIHADNYLYHEQSSRFPDVARMVEQGLKTGVGYFTYSGHAESTGLDGTELWRYHHVNAYRYKTWPFAVFATCSTLYFDTQTTGIAEKTFFQRDGGAIGVYAACREVYLEHNRTLNTAVASAYAKATDGTTIGDLVRIARNGLIANGLLSSLGNNIMCYNLCGDPAVPVCAPTHRIVVEEIGGTSVENGNSVSVNALGNVLIKARVTDVNGNFMENFNGIATIDVYDTPQVYSFVPEPTQPATKFDIRVDHSYIASVLAPVVNGRIEYAVVPGNPASEGEYNRVVISATEEHGATAAGVSLAMSVKKSAEPDSDVDSSAPVIEEMYLDTPDFVSGDVVSRTPTFVAVVSPSATGLDTRFGNMNNLNSLVLDGKVTLTRSASGFAPGLDGKLHLSMPLLDLVPGRHSIMLKVANHLGHTDSRTIDFSVTDTAAAATLSLSTDTEVVRDRVVISFNCNDPEGQPRRMVILNDRDETVFTRNNMSMPFMWDLTDRYGSPVPDGHYRAYVLYDTPTGKSATPMTEIVVLK